MRLKGSFEIVTLEDSFVAVPVGEGSSQFRGVIKMNNSSLQVFQMMQQGLSEEEITDKLSKEYTDSSKEQVQAYVRSFVTEFDKKGLLETE